MLKIHYHASFTRIILKPLTPLCTFSFVDIFFIFAAFGNHFIIIFKSEALVLVKQASLAWKKKKHAYPPQVIWFIYCFELLHLKALWFMLCSEFVCLFLACFFLINNSGTTTIVEQFHNRYENDYDLFCAGLRTRYYSLIRSRRIFGKN